MKQKRWYGKDTGLSLRMVLTGVGLIIVYLAFLTLLSFFLDFIFLLIFAALFVFVQFYFSDKLVLMSTGAKIVSPQEAPQLHTLVERLCTVADLPKPRVAVINSQVPNAFATGRNQKSAVVAVTTGLLNKLNTPELEAVLGHELTHVKNRDVLVITLASFLSTVAWFIMRFFVYSSLFRGGSRDKSAAAGVIIFLASLLVWLISYLLIRALSRYREFAADRGAAIMTGNPPALISALLKISGAMQRVPTKDLREVEGLNAFFIIPALSAGSIMALFSTHPPIEKRIARLEAMERTLEGVR
ncbi:MAG TPA: zinc metalloprotease HtpX [Methanomicrobia archaeon]|nr:zinc metalloprotease HtpX [Methanomicrobia archaeon]